MGFRVLGFRAEGDHGYWGVGKRMARRIGRWENQRLTHFKALGIPEEALTRGSIYTTIIYGIRSQNAIPIVVLGPNSTIGVDTGLLGCKCIIGVSFAVSAF